MKKYLLFIICLFVNNVSDAANDITLRHSIELLQTGANIIVNISNAEPRSRIEVCIDNIPYSSQKCAYTTVNNVGIGVAQINHSYSSRSPDYCSLTLDEKGEKAKLMAYYSINGRRDAANPSEPVEIDLYNLFAKPVGTNCRIREITEQQLNNGTACVVFVKLNQLTLNTVHNNDCKRLQGDINIELVNTISGDRYPLHTGNSKLVSYAGNRQNGFEVRNVENTIGEVAFRIDNLSLNANLIELQINGSKLKGCHKNCDLCTDYHCNINYGTGLFSRNKIRLSPRTLQYRASVNGAGNHGLNMNLSTTYLRKEDVSSDKRLITIRASNFSSVVHNNDCNRHQGELKVSLINNTNRETITAADNSDILLSWRGSKAADFEVRTVNRTPTREVKFYIDPALFSNRNYSILIEAGNLKSCHKQCDLCSGYHCNLRYEDLIIPAFSLRDNSTQINLRANNAGGIDNHVISFDLDIR